MLTNDFAYYSAFWNAITYILFFIGLVSSLYYYMKGGKVHPLNPLWVIMCFVLVVLLMGYFPVLRGSADREYYYMWYLQIQQGVVGAENFKDSGFYYFQKIVSFLPVKYFFVYFSFVYTLCVYVFCRSITKEFAGILFLGYILSFLFVNYGVNTMRAGLASSFLLLAMTFRNKIYLCIILLIVTISIHFSMLLPVIAYLISRYWDKTKLYFMIWLISIPASFMIGHLFEAYMVKLNPDERVSYLMVNAMDTHYKVGFRIDFILYSCFPALLGYYYIYKKKCRDVFYCNLYNMYLLSNTFWILVIRANFSDRFAYLSWFIYSIVLLYPLVTDSIVKRQGLWIGTIFLGLTLFRFVFII